MAEIVGNNKRTRFAARHAACFFARPDTRRKLEDAGQAKVILIGGFTGPWNFGDLIQLSGALRWHTAREPRQMLCPLHGLATAASPDYLGRLYRVFATEDWLFCSRTRDRERAASLGLEPLSATISGPTLLHVYGGGFFNGMWGERALDGSSPSSITSRRSATSSPASRWAVSSRRPWPSTVASTSLTRSAAATTKALPFCTRRA